MSNYHSTMQNAVPETTEWEDLQVKHGNWEAREKPKPPPQWTPEEQQQQLHKNKVTSEREREREGSHSFSPMTAHLDASYKHTSRAEVTNQQLRLSLSLSHDHHLLPFFSFFSSLLLLYLFYPWLYLV